MGNRRKIMFFSGLGFIGFEMFILAIAGLSYLDWGFINIKFLIFSLIGLLNIFALVMMILGLRKDENEW